MEGKKMIFWLSCLFLIFSAGILTSSQSTGGLTLSGRIYCELQGYCLVLNPHHYMFIHKYFKCRYIKGDRFWKQLHQKDTGAVRGKRLLLGLLPLWPDECYKTTNEVDDAGLPGL